MQQLILASSSPRRVALLNQLQLNFSAISPGIDETRFDGELYSDYVSRMSREKALSVIEAQNGGKVVLSGDTVVLLEGELLGKPADKDDAIEMLLRLSGKTHQVITSVTVAGAKREGFHYQLADSGLENNDPVALDTQLVETNVQFRVLTMGECESYWRTGEPADKAGGYGIQGLGAVFVERLEGSYSNVVGLPLAETARLLSNFGIDCLLRPQQKS